MAQELWVCHLGTVEYRSALALQERLRAARQQEDLPDVMLTLEHWPVYTRGRRSAPGELPMGEEWYAMQGIETVETDRGGKVTYHGPGQLVGYPIVRIDDVVTYVHTLERALVAALAQEGLRARARPEDGPDFTGVWVDERKIASIGVHVSRGISTHGFAVNLDIDLDPFSWVIACGMPDVTMTSLARELPGGREVDASGFRARMAICFCEAHARDARPAAAQELGLGASPQPAVQMQGRIPRAGAIAGSGARV
jgi:lipoyl(octanoyl) transferase